MSLSVLCMYHILYLLLEFGKLEQPRYLDSFTELYINEHELLTGLGSVSVNIRVMDFSHNNITYIAPYYFR